MSDPHKPSDYADTPASAEGTAISADEIYPSEGEGYAFDEGHDPEQEYESEEGHDPEQEYESEEGHDPEQEYESEEGHDPEQEYESEEGHDPEQEYESEEGHDPEQEYESEEGHDPEQEYESEEGYDPEQEYESEEGHDPEQEYESEEGYDPEQEYESEEGYDPEQEYESEEEEAEGLDHPLAQDLMLNPSKWRIWPAVAVLRWLLRKMEHGIQQIVYRSKPSLRFCPSEIDDVAIDPSGIELILNAPGIAAPGSPLPTSDIDRIMRDSRRGGALAMWLDGPGDRFMQALEASRARNNAAFALATGGRIEALRVTANLVGRSAPLAATQGGVLYSSFQREPEGAIGLVGLFAGPASGSGLTELFRSFTSLPIQIKEFTGAEVLTLRPARVGRPLGLILGSRCTPSAAGIDIVINGGSDPAAQEWARDTNRHRSLRFLAVSYIGSPTPEAHIFLQLDPGNVPPLVLDGSARIGGLAVMGPPKRSIRIPLRD